MPPSTIREARLFRPRVAVRRARIVDKARPGTTITTSIVGDPLLITRMPKGRFRRCRPSASTGRCWWRRPRPALILCLPVPPLGVFDRRRSARRTGNDRSVGFRKSDSACRAFAVETWQGFIFRHFDVTASATRPAAARGRRGAGQLPRGAGRWAGRTNVSLAWNWKVMFENNNDGYPREQMQSWPLHDFVPSRLATFPELPADTPGTFRQQRHHPSRRGVQRDTEGGVPSIPRSHRRAEQPHELRQRAADAVTGGAC